MSDESTVEVPERAAVIGASLLKKNAKAYYQQNRTGSADILHASARQLAEGTDVEWGDLDGVALDWESDDDHRLEGAEPQRDLTDAEPATVPDDAERDDNDDPVFPEVDDA